MLCLSLSRQVLYKKLGAKLAVGMPFKDIATSDSVVMRELPPSSDKEGRRALRRLQVGGGGRLTGYSGVRAVGSLAVDGNRPRFEGDRANVRRGCCKQGAGPPDLRYSTLNRVGPMMRAPWHRECPATHPSTPLRLDCSGGPFASSLSPYPQEVTTHVIAPLEALARDPLPGAIALAPLAQAVKGGVALPQVGKGCVCVCVCGVPRCTPFGKRRNGETVPATALSYVGGAVYARKSAPQSGREGRDGGGAAKGGVALLQVVCAWARGNTE